MPHTAAAGLSSGVRGPASACSLSRRIQDGISRTPHPGEQPHIPCNAPVGGITLPNLVRVDIGSVSEDNGELGTTREPRMNEPLRNGGGRDDA